ncbi:YveK family protein [Bacillus sp. 1NLA3E]|uniref:YveK family protein n=1 Tax=Bacillus sp. 1NLA3E TaxID=666686 RepID=UPI0003121227|nr:Wzz/FepE/Etk N-terminal domain-containing protein [Bacillus sp. 1NLA3E]AGK52646.1 capsular polysaccharide biosynthesis protein [Bacillus sp. 1NLA3E]
MRGNPTNYSQKQVAKEINLKELYHVIKGRFWIVILITLLATSAGAIYSTFFTTPLYQSSTKIIIDADAEYRKTLQVIIKDSTVLEKVVKELGIERSSEALAGQITVASIDNSQVVSISVVDSDPNQAAKIANTTAKVFKDEIPNIIDFNKVTILSDAKVFPFPINENQNRTIMISFVLGLIIGIGLVLLLDSLDDSIKSEYEVEELLGLPVIGTVSKMNNKNVKKKNNSYSELEIRGETIGLK